jgi:hypothetical protein
MTVLVICKRSDQMKLGKGVMRGRTIESPCHQLLNNQEDDDGRNVVLDRHC